VFERNFDPASLTASHSVNGNQYIGLLQSTAVEVAATINGEHFIILTTDVVETLEYPYDDIYFSAVADWKWAFPAIGQGLFYVGLTQDDVGGLRYLLSSQNVNLEELLPDVRGAGGQNYVNLALRPGVEKLTFVNKNYDSVRGRLSSPWSYKFQDAYFSTEIEKHHQDSCRGRSRNDCHCPCSTNLVLRHQELERVASQPDFLFSATNLSRGLLRPEFITTSTSNWWNSAVVDHTGALGPGVIRPPVRITFDRRGPALQTADYYRFVISDPSTIYDNYWGSFDLTTNPPITFPQTTPASRTNSVTVRLWLHERDAILPDATFATFVWHAPATVGASAIMQTSSNLTDWVSVRTNSIGDGPIIWNHVRYNDCSFFRVQVR
jgi:hypothetical protein